MFREPSKIKRGSQIPVRSKPTGTKGKLEKKTYYNAIQSPKYE